MVTFGDPNRLIGFNRDVFSRYSHQGRMLVKLLACEVYSSVGDDHVRWSNVDIYPVKA